MGRVLFHIDINAFFASAEEIRHPEFIGKPLAIGSKNKRSVISTANYIAREKGVHSAMPVYQALELCPELILQPGDFNYYRMLSNKFFNYLKRYTHQIEPASIDECYMDVTEIIKQYKRPLDLAYQIQSGIKQETGLSVSIGVAPNRFLAKMASDMRKPSGITILRISEIETKLWPLDISKMHGIGKKTIPVLRQIGIQTIGDFANVENEQKILKLMKNSGYALIQKARGHSSSLLHYSSTQKSISVSKTYTTNLYTIQEVYNKTMELSKELSSRLIKDNQKGKLLSISLRDTSFHTIVRSKPMNAYTNQYQMIYEIAQSLIEENFEPVGYRFIALTMASIQNANQIIDQMNLFEKPMQDSKSIIESLNREMKQNVFMSASDLLKGKRQ
ncbi:DNA polymerase IV [Floccifex sp.]|uniref:DNA polymerase IV n=1 Tax=Floccifex sp. TaxID=2815810 RepID=UPI003F02FCA0